MNRIEIVILTTRDISDPETGWQIGTTIRECSPELFPDRIGNWEPITNHCLSPDDFRRHWQWPVLAKRRKPRSDLSVWFRKPHRKYSSIHIDVASHAHVTSDLSRLLSGLATLAQAEFGMVQTVTDAYRERADSKGLLAYLNTMKTLFYISLTDESLADGLPDAFDMMWLPEREWDVKTPALVRRPDGVYALRNDEMNIRDSALKGIHRRANDPVEGTR